eukprot:GILK01004686.1.p1 GENE.GILK01004686.1~~GILK01004686.1.p1  ORF type:complete len:580 (-),score=66.12 GILK01004686.1:161-1879(-)
MEVVSNALQSTVELGIKCCQLIKKDILSNSDPCVVLEVRNRHGQWESFGRTEVIKDNNNPEFAKTFVVPYFFEEVQILRFRVYDIDNESASLDDDDFLGEAQMNLGEVMGARGQSLIKSLQIKSRAAGTIIVRGEELQSCRESVRFNITGTKVASKDGFFSKSDPYLTLSRLREDGQYQKVHQTEIIKNKRNPKWKEFSISVQKLCNGDHMRPLLFQCYDWDKNSNHDLIGQFTVSLATILAGGVREFQLVDPVKQQKKPKYTHSGLIQINQAQLYMVPTFLDYIRGGCEINLIAAVDFTGSNGDAHLPHSLHYLDPQMPTEYARSLQAVGEILLQYDSDGNIPAYGFGAMVPALGMKTSHCFPLNLNSSNPEVTGIEGLLNAYYHTVQTVQLSGPTNFGDVIRNAMTIASQCVTQDRQKYFVLLILTDGEITDLDVTISNLVEASQLPLSVVIVGVGKADFAAMKVLDGDERKLCDRSGRECQRDIVQFVAFRDYGHHNYQNLARDTLAEIPSQLVSFMSCRGLLPNPPLPPAQFVPQPVPQQEAPPTSTIATEAANAVVPPASHGEAHSA